jgi:hypothetical protein
MKRLAVLLLACVLGSGCFVFDEIDEGKAMLKSPKDKSDAKVAAAKAKAGAPAAKGGKDWWASAKSIEAPADAEPGDPNTPVSCQLHGSTRFMRRGDCLSQGGRPAR